MRPFWARSSRQGTLAVERGSGWRARGLWVQLGVLVPLLCLVFAGRAQPVEAQDYSAYWDPEKPATAFILSEDVNAEEFRREFDLSEAEMEVVLAAVREENDVLAREYAESEREIGGDEGQTEDSVAEYNARVRAAIAQTKKTVEDQLSEEQVPRLREWVDAKFAQENREASEDIFSEDRSARRAQPIRCRVYASYYDAFTRYEVALPHRALKFRGGYRVSMRPASGGRRVTAPIKEVGPWNTFDNYWHTRKKRDMWRSLPRCTPEAEAAYFRNFHKGRDEQGRIVRNPAGLDMTLAVAQRLGIKKQMQRRGLVRVFVKYPWVRR